MRTGISADEAQALLNKFGNDRAAREQAAGRLKTGGD
jgi:hypothetical protein